MIVRTPPVPTTPTDGRPNYARYVREFRAAARPWLASGLYALDVYGRARMLGGRRVPLLRVRSKLRRGRGGLVVVAGFHGEEPAGPLTLLHFFDHVVGRAARLRVPLTVVPITHPHGWDTVLRTTVDGAYTNAGFFHDEDPLAPESAALRDVLVEARPHVYLDLHEDIAERSFYLYSFGDRAVARRLVGAAGPLINVKRGKLAREAHLRVDDDALLHELHDGSSEDLASHLGAMASFASETPGTQPMRQRMHVDLAVIDAALDAVAHRRPPTQPARASRRAHV